MLDHGPATALKGVPLKKVLVVNPSLNVVMEEGGEECVVPWGR